MELNEREIDYIISLLEYNNAITNNNIKKVADYKEVSKLKERFDFVDGIINKLKQH